MNYDKFIDLFIQRLHVEIDTFINSNSCSEQDRSLGRIEGVADCIRYLQGQKENAI